LSPKRRRRSAAALSETSVFHRAGILTVNPTTTGDFRRLLIDLETVRNAWIVCKQCACELIYYAWCDQDLLTLSYEQPANIKPAPQTVWAGSI